MSTVRVPKSRRGDLAWEIARLYPFQGSWSEDDYFALDTNLLVELSNGSVEFPPMATTLHQLIIAWLYKALDRFVDARQLGTVLFAALPVRLWEGKIREPDVLFMLADHSHRMHTQYWEGADLVMEVVSGKKKDRQRDLVEKRGEYAKAGIPEYWIVDPKKSAITVLKLKGRKYATAGVYGPGSHARSVLLKGFEVDVSAALAGGAVNGRKK